MDENFVERLRVIRERLGVSGRKLSLELGLNANAWASYESGGTMPGSPVIDALSMRGVNLNWLFRGTGEPWLNSGGTEGLDLTTYIKEQDNKVYRGLGLGRLALIAASGTISKRNTILKALLGERLSLAELVTTTTLTTDELVPVLIDLMEEHMIEEVILDGVKYFQTAKDLCWSLPKTRPDTAQVVLESVERLVQDVYPTATNEPSRAVLLQGTVYVKEPKAWLKEMVEQIRIKSENEHELELEPVTLVLGAAIREP